MGGNDTVPGKEQLERIRRNNPWNSHRAGNSLFLSAKMEKPPDSCMGHQVESSERVSRQERGKLVLAVALPSNNKA